MTTQTQPLHPLRGLLQGKTRILLAWIFGLVLVLSARSLPQPPGIVVCFLGATLRFWASGFLRKDSRPAVGGPYSFVRNPLYLGTYLMAIGTAAAVENWWLTGVITVIFAAVYHFIILDEEEKLERIFGAPYQTYLTSVPRFFPRIFPPFWPAAVATLVTINPEPTHLHFSWELAMKNKAYEAYATFVALIGLIALTATLWNHFS